MNAFYAPVSPRPERYEAVDVAASAFVVWPLHVLYGLGLLRS